MRSPSARCLVNTVSLYRAIVTQDEDGGRVVTYGAAIATSVPCSVQPADPMRFLDETTGRLTSKMMFSIYFRTAQGLRLDDKIIWVDTTGATHNLYAHEEDDMAGRGAAFKVQAEERL